MAQNLYQATSALPQVLVSTRLASTGDTSVYSCPGASAVKISNGSLCNTTAGAVNVGLSLIKSGGTADGTHRIIDTSYSLAAGDTLPLREYIGLHNMGPGDSISVYAGTANAVDVVISGTVFS